MAKKELKTNVMRVLDSKKLAYNHYAYDNSTVNGVEVAGCWARTRTGCLRPW